MKVFSSIIGLLLLCLSFCSTTYGQGSIKFPEDFFLTPFESPSGFELLPVDEDAKAEGLTSNPGLVPVATFGPNMYKDANITAISQIMLAVYRKKDPDQDTDITILEDIHIATIVYKSVKELDKEVAKFSIHQELKYFLRKDNYLVILSGYAISSSREAIHKIATELSARIGLQKLAVEDKTPVFSDPEVIQISVE